MKFAADNFAARGGRGEILADVCQNGIKSFTRLLGRQGQESKVVS
jgi:hypothetical protein